jgi:hypothetical protein
MPSKNSHGGQRENAGRKHVNPLEPTKIVTVRLSQSQYEWLQSRGNISDTLRSLIDEQMGTFQNISSNS